MEREMPATRTPRVLVAIVDGPLTLSREMEALSRRGWAAPRVTGGEVPPGVVGSAIRFEGIVRRGEPCGSDAGQERALRALLYQTYDPMAERELTRLAREVAEHHGLLGLAALHSRGEVCVGEVSFVLIVESSHRAEGITAMSEFIDRMKRDVPIWKRAAWAD